MGSSECNKMEYKHKERCCKLCPKGQVIKETCSENSETICETCPSDNYMENMNFLYNCFPCKICDQNSHLKVSKPCQADSDAQCVCMDGYYSKDEHCHKVKQCPPGSGVLNKPTDKTDTTCTTCAPGTFSNLTDHQTPCSDHINCQNLGRHLLTHGTARSDAVCGDFIYRCSWMVPASLWVGFILSVVLVCGILFCWMKYRKKTVTISLTSEKKENSMFILPPDIIKHPREPVLVPHLHNESQCAKEDLGHFETDGVELQMIPQTSDFLPVTPNTCPNFLSASSIFKSEPEEDEWVGV